METLRPYFEILYFVTGGPVLAFFAFLALKQIAVAKQTSKTASLREAYRLAAEQVHVYATEIVPKLNEIDKAIKEKEITFFANSSVKVEGNSVRIERKSAEGDIKGLVEIASLVASSINRLETFSLFFTSKVASEKVAYSSVGATYVRSVTLLMPLIVPSALNKNHENIMQLFLLWHNRLEGERLEHERDELESKLGRMKKSELVPIGAIDEE